MPIEVLIKQGDIAADSKDFLTAISKYTEALGQNPHAFAPLIKRAQAYTRLCDYDSAKADISKAFTLSEQRGSMAEKATCYFRLGVVNYSEKHYMQAHTNFQWAKTYKSSEPALDIWIEKARRDCVKNGLFVGDNEGGSINEVEEDMMRGKQLEGDTPKQNESQKNHSQDIQSSKNLPQDIQSSKNLPQDIQSSKNLPQHDQSENHIQSSNNLNVNSSSSAHTLNKQAPIKLKIRDEWYQSKESVTISIYAANVAPETVQVHFSCRSVSVSFPTSQNSEYNYSLDHLAGDIIPDKCSYNVMTKKLEISLTKAVPNKWSTLEADAVAGSTSQASSTPSYPSSSRKKTDWAKFDAGDDEPDANPEDFFAKLYKDVDEDTRRAMMKSYVESNGTVLTTNWNEAKDKKFDTRPPDGMEAKKW